MLREPLSCRAFTRNDHSKDDPPVESKAIAAVRPPTLKESDVCSMVYLNGAGEAYGPELSPLMQHTALTNTWLADVDTYLDVQRHGQMMSFGF